MASRMDSNDKGKGIFKKRAHRPWKPALLETIIHNPEETFDNEYNDHQQIELRHNQLESSLAEKARERGELLTKLSLKEECRITIGGFFHPKNIVFSNEGETLQQTSLLMHDLKEKEQEILELTNNLKITQAEERAKHAEAEYLAETKAREAAEEKAIFALSKAQTSNDYIRLAEERALNAEQTMFKLEQVIKQLEEKIHVGDLEYKKLVETYQNAGHQIKATNLSLSDTLYHHEQTKIAIEEKVVLLSEELMILESTLQSEKGHSTALEGEIASLHEKMNQYVMDRAAQEEQFNKDGAQVSKMLIALNAERGLRKFYEEKAKEISHQVFAIELQRKAEEQGRKAAEEKAKQTLEQASKAVMQLLNVPVSH